MPFPVAPYNTCSFCLDLSGDRECAFITDNEYAAAQVDERQYERGAMLVITKNHRETILDIEESAKNIHCPVRSSGRLKARMVRALASPKKVCRELGRNLNLSDPF